MRLSKKATASWASSPGVTIPDAHPMKKEEFQFLCTKLDITDNVTASELFGMSWRNCQRYWYGETDTPGPLARLLRLAYKHKLTHAGFRQLKPVIAKASRQKTNL